MKTVKFEITDEQAKRSNVAVTNVYLEVQPGESSSALRAQLHTEIEQFKAEVAVALEELRADWQRQKIETIDPSESLYPDQQGHNSRVESFVEDLDAVIIKLGLMAEATEVSE